MLDVEDICLTEEREESIMSRGTGQEKRGGRRHCEATHSSDVHETSKLVGV